MNIKQGPIKSLKNVFLFPILLVAKKSLGSNSSIETDTTGLLGWGWGRKNTSTQGSLEWGLEKPSTAGFGGGCCVQGSGAVCSFCKISGPG